MFLVEADGRLTFGARSETSSNQLIRAHLEREHLNIPPALIGTTFSAFALAVENTDAISIWFFTTMDGKGTEPAQLVNLETGTSVLLPGFTRFRINSLFADRVDVLRDQHGVLVLRLTHNPGNLAANPPSPIQPVDIDLDRQTIYSPNPPAKIITTR